MCEPGCTLGGNSRDLGTVVISLENGVEIYTPKHPVAWEDESLLRK